jgi:hypothetical protein
VPDGFHLLTFFPFGKYKKLEKVRQRCNQKRGSLGGASLEFRTHVSKESNQF